MNTVNPQRRRVLKTVAAGSIVALAGCGGGGSGGSGPVYEAAEEFESLLEAEAQDTTYLPVSAAEGGFIDVEETGENRHRVVVGSTAITDTTLCDGGPPATETVKAAFESQIGRPYWIGTFAHKMYEDLGPLNAAYRSADEDAIETYAFEFEGGGATITFEASSEQMAEWAFDETTLDHGMFRQAFFEGMNITC